MDNSLDSYSPKGSIMLPVHLSTRLLVARKSLEMEKEKKTGYKNMISKTFLQAFCITVQAHKSIALSFTPWLLEVHGKFPWWRWCQTNKESSGAKWESGCSSCAQSSQGFLFKLPHHMSEGIHQLWSEKHLLWGLSCASWCKCIRPTSRPCEDKFGHHVTSTHIVYSCLPFVYITRKPYVRVSYLLSSSLARYACHLRHPLHEPTGLQPYTQHARPAEHPVICSFTLE